CKNPSRDLPIGIIASLVVCTILYVVVGAVFAGIIPYNELVQKLANEQAEPLTMALDHAAPKGVTWPSTLVAFGSVIAHTAVLLVFQLGQPRIFFSMARDGLLPPVFATVHPKFKTPHVTTIITGVLVGGIAGFATVDEMVSLTNIGTLFAFILVCVGVIVLRRKDPDRPRPFRVPFGPYLLPILGAVSCAALIYFLPEGSYWRFIGWLAIGLAIYLAYGYSRSAVGQKAGRGARTPPLLKVGAVGFLLVAAGLFYIPHDATFGQLLDKLTGADPEQHGRTLTGFVIFLVGLVIGVCGAAFGTTRAAAEGAER
ncbi:MAG TPA: amino acid permease, partial [Pyrinomonadaceae bacterium]